MPDVTVNPHRSDPYKNHKFRVKWDGRYVAGISSVCPLRRTTEVVSYRVGSEPRLIRKVPGLTAAPITISAAFLRNRSIPASTGCRREGREVEG